MAGKAKKEKPAAKKDKPAAHGASRQRWLFHSASGLVAIVAVGVVMLRPGGGVGFGPDGPAAVDGPGVTFVNPSPAPVSLLKLDESEERALATLQPGGGAHTLQVRTGEKYAFAAAGRQQRHVVRIARGLARYSYNQECRNIYDQRQCDHFARLDKCNVDPGWMSVHCAVSCDACHLMDPKVRCDLGRLNMSAEHAVQPGGIEAMFRSLQGRYPQYNVEIVSQPPQGPWVATFEDFISEEEAEAIRRRTTADLKRSTDQGSIDAKTGVQEQVVSKSRTSSNSWCTDRNQCSTDPMVQQLLAKISEVVQVPEPNFESIQVLRYEEGQEYKEHHDVGRKDYMNDMLAGPRLYTFFLYFNDVEEGGGTYFPKLNITVQPKKYKALLWPHLKDEDPRKVDMRTTHAALPVVRGTKYAANVWVHTRNFVLPNIWGCTGAFS